MKTALAAVLAAGVASACCIGPVAFVLLGARRVRSASRRPGAVLLLARADGGAHWRSVLRRIPPDVRLRHVFSGIADTHAQRANRQRFFLTAFRSGRRLLIA